MNLSVVELTTGEELNMSDWRQMSFLNILNSLLIMHKAEKLALYPDPFFISGLELLLILPQPVVIVVEDIWWEWKKQNDTVKSCIKAAANFQLFGAASIQVWLLFQVRLLFEGGLYAKSWVCKTRKSGLAHVKWKWNLTWRLF